MLLEVFSFVIKSHSNHHSPCKCVIKTWHLTETKHAKGT